MVLLRARPAISRRKLKLDSTELYDVVGCQAGDAEDLAAVEKGAVGTFEVADVPRTVFVANFRVVSGEERLVDHDVAGGMTADPDADADAEGGAYVELGFRRIDDRQICPGGSPAGRL